MHSSHRAFLQKRKRWELTSDRLTLGFFSNLKCVKSTLTATISMEGWKLDSNVSGCSAAADGFCYSFFVLVRTLGFSSYMINQATEIR